MQKQRGFSLIELLVVVAVILIIAAIAIPGFERSRISANEASAVVSMRAVNTAQVSYATTYTSIGYADDLAKLGSVPGPPAPPSANAAGLLDWVLGCMAQPCAKSGYNFSINAGPGPQVNTYSITAVPILPGRTGYRGFCGDQLNHVMFDPNGGVACVQTLQ
jgi:type IV pilus assembly protein PilA